MKNIIPKHEEGKKIDCFESTEFDGAEIARDFYQEAKRRLLDINRWSETATLPSATFQLSDRSGKEIERLAQEGDLVRIDIPGPGLPSSGGYDWVRVERIDEQNDEHTQRIVLTLRPTSDPMNPDPDTAHFFKDLATSTFLLEQKHNVVSIQYAGRNELVNTENTKISDNLRNFLVGIGAKMGASFPQWKALAAGIVKQNQTS